MDFALVAIGILFSAITATAALLIVIELRYLRRQRKQQYTGEFLSSFNVFPFPYSDFDKDVLKELMLENGRQLTSEAAEKRQNLIEYLNGLELIAVQLNQGTLDEETCRKFARSSFLSAFHRLRYYILNVREATENPRLYADFERVVRRWERLNDN